MPAGVERRLSLGGRVAKARALRVSSW